MPKLVLMIWNCCYRFAWLDFKDTDGFNKALQLDGTEIGGCTLVVVEGKARRHNHGGRGGGGGRFGGWHGGDGWGRERSDGSSWWHWTPNKLCIAASGTGIVYLSPEFSVPWLISLPNSGSVILTWITPDLSPLCGDKVLTIDGS